MSAREYRYRSRYPERSQSIKVVTARKRRYRVGDVTEPFELVTQQRHSGWTLFFQYLSTNKSRAPGVHVATLLFLLSSIIGVGYFADRAVAMGTKSEIMELPDPRQDSGFSLERALVERRSMRQFSDEAITLPQLSQLLWSGQGVTNSRGLRTAPSAGALYPLEVYVSVGNVEGLAIGLYKYQPATHRLSRLTDEDRRTQISKAAWDQDWVRKNAVLLVFSSVHSRTTEKYGGRGIRYVYIELGHAAQNVLLQAQALGLGAAVVGAFQDDSVAQILGLPRGERAIYLIPIGRPAPSN